MISIKHELINNCYMYKVSLTETFMCLYT